MSRGGTERPDGTGRAESPDSRGITGDPGGTVRKRIRFFGWVQGVGFRWRACRAAEAYGATGWVRNEYDGSVSMELQGTEAQIDRVIMSLEQGRFIRIGAMDVRSIPPAEDERGFSVRDDLW